MYYKARYNTFSFNHKKGNDFIDENPRMAHNLLFKFYSLEDIYEYFKFYLGPKPKNIFFKIDKSTVTVFWSVETDTLKTFFKRSYLKVH